MGQSLFLQPVPKRRGFRVLGLGFRVWGLGFRVLGLAGVAIIKPSTKAVDSARPHPRSEYISTSVYLCARAFIVLGCWFAPLSAYLCL